MRGLRQWSYLLKGTEIPILVFTDHANLRYYHDPQKIGLHVAGYLPEREQYNMLLEYKPGATNRADGLSRCPDYEGDNPDNNDILIWPNEYFCEQHMDIQVFEFDSEADDLDTQVYQAQKAHQLELKQMATAHNLTLDPEHEDTWCHRTVLVVVADNVLRRGVITLFHDHKASRHPGITKTLQLISPYYWWPNMKAFITEYIRGCATCQMSKVNTNPGHPPLFPIIPAENTLPFETIAMDFITKLPPSGGHDMILTITDMDCSKASVFIPCKETINSEGVAQLLLTHMVPHYRVPKKIILDRDTQFTSKFATELCCLLDIQQNISTAYHPQTDSTSEHANQSLEQYLCLFCRTQQNNWHTWLPLAQYTKNSWPSATTKKAPYDLLIGYTPKIHQPRRSTDIPTVEDHLTSIKEAREAAQEAQCKAQESWIKDRPRFKPFEVGTKVWLEGTNLRLPSTVTPKLSPRRYRPFEVVSQISHVAYKIQLPPTWKIHDVFHASLLTPYKETEQHSPNFIEPPPDIVEGKPEWEVKKILKEHTTGQWKKKQYLVRWKGYSPAHDSWVDESDLHTPELIEEFQSQSGDIIRVTTISDPSSTASTPRPSSPAPSTSQLPALSYVANVSPSPPTHTLTP